MLLLINHKHYKKRLTNGQPFFFVYEIPDQVGDDNGKSSGMTV